MNGVVAPVCSLICLARAHSASDTDCGSNLGNGDDVASAVVDEPRGGEVGGVEREVWGGANVARTSRMSSSYCPWISSVPPYNARVDIGCGGMAICDLRFAIGLQGCP